MKRSILFVLACLFIVCPASIGQSQQQCGVPNMTLVSQWSSVPCTYTQFYQPQTTTTITSYQDTCTNYQTGSVYFNVASTNTGTGQCVTVNDNTMIICNAIVESQATTATSPSDYNRFYNRAYGNTLAFNSAGNYICGGQGSGPYTQDFKQCQGQSCPCPGNPSFVCCNSNGGVGASSPVCTTGGWTCSTGDGQGCDPDNQPEDCTAGEEPTCECGGSWSCEPLPGTPIIIDTDGSGFHLTSAANGVRFDIRADGQPIQIAWTAPGSRNAWLALPDSNGKVPSGKQLFGNVTPQPPSLDPNGFLALAVYDQPDHGGNGDGVIDSRDAIWPQLRLWIDSNHDGVAQPEELHTLPSLGINSLSLAYTESKFTDQFGNQFRYKGRVNPEGQPPSDRVDRVMYDVFLSIPTAGTTGAQQRGQGFDARLLKRLNTD